MLVTKTRTTIIALVASASLTAASVAPTVSQAKWSGPGTGDERGPAKEPPWVKTGLRLETSSASR